VTPTAEDRDALFKAFSRAFFKRDVEAMYQVVAPDFVWQMNNTGEGAVTLASPGDISRHFEARKAGGKDVRFEDVVYHHADDATFMTFRMRETCRETGATQEHMGVERYTFRDGKIALKDVYRKPTNQE
jgi:ketosteroid isomerase-like protein